MKKPKILIASVLKPVDDVRSYERFARALVPDCQVLIVGAPSRNLPDPPPQIEFFPYPFFPKTFFERLKTSFFLLKNLFSFEPDTIIVQSPDLLPVAVFYKFFRKCSTDFSLCVIYDIQENYFSNIFYQNYYTSWKKYLLAYSVRLIETVCSVWIDHFFLAEKSYAEELGFLRSKPARFLKPCGFEDKNSPIFLIENKYAPLLPFPPLFVSSRTTHSKKLHFLYTGTVSEVYGTHLAIDLVKTLFAENQAIRLTLIGVCSDKKYWKRLEKLVENCPFIDWKVSPEPVSHRAIIEEIEKADVGILSYLPNKSTENCVPSKIYEYLAHRLPMILPSNPLWESLTVRYQAGLVVDFQHINATKLLFDLQNFPFYQTEIPENVWRFEETNFKKIVLRK